MKNTIRLLPFLLLAVFASCSESKSDTTGCQCNGEIFTLNEPFFLNYGSEACFLNNESFTIQFKDVYGDSRCPSDAICVWEGRFDAGVVLKWNQEQNPDTLAKSGLAGTSARDSVFFHNYKIKLLSAEPYPAMATPTAIEDYKLKLVITQ